MLPIRVYSTNYIMLCHIISSVKGEILPSPVFLIPLLLNYTQGLLFCHTKAYLEVGFTFLFFHLTFLEGTLKMLFILVFNCLFME